MKFIALIYGDPSASPQPGDDQFDAYIGEYGQITEEYEAAGIMGASEALQDVSTAKSMRERNGEISVMDGPFAETKEQLGGFYLFDVPDIETAMAQAKKIPDIRYGTIEVRPIMDVSEFM